jgi:hypothetical protein
MGLFIVSTQPLIYTFVKRMIWIVFKGKHPDNGCTLAKGLDVTVYVKVRPLLEAILCLVLLLLLLL